MAIMETNMLTSVDDPFAVATAIVARNLVHENTTYRFLSTNNNFIKVNPFSSQVSAYLMNSSWAYRLEFISQLSKYYHLYYLHPDTLTSNDLLYLSIMPHETLITVRVDESPGAHVQHQLRAINATRPREIYLIYKQNGTFRICSAVKNRQKRWKIV